MTYHGPIRQECYLDVSFSDILWLKVLAYLCAVYMNKTFSYRKVSYI